MHHMPPDRACSPPTHGTPHARPALTDHLQFAQTGHRPPLQGQRPTQSVAVKIPVGWQATHISMCTASGRHTTSQADAQPILILNTSGVASPSWAALCAIGGTSLPLWAVLRSYKHMHACASCCACRVVSCACIPQMPRGWVRFTGANSQGYQRSQSAPLLGQRPAQLVVAQVPAGGQGRIVDCREACTASPQLELTPHPCCVLQMLIWFIGGNSPPTVLWVVVVPSYMRLRALASCCAYYHAMNMCSSISERAACFFCCC
jgi:hypothetical protein